MGYAGYVPAKLPPSRKSPLQQALADIACMESLDVIGKLLYNTAVSPKEEKYRRIRLTNPKISKALVETPGSMQSMVLFGWEPEGEEYLVLTKNITMAEVRMVEDAKDELKKSLRTAARTALPRAQASAAPHLLSAIMV